MFDMCGRLKKYGLSESSSDVNIRRISSFLDVQSVENLPLCEEDIKWLRNARQIILDTDQKENRQYDKKMEEILRHNTQWITFLINKESLLVSEDSSNSAITSLNFSHFLVLHWAPLLPKTTSKHFIYLATILPKYGLNFRAIIHYRFRCFSRQRLGCQEVIRPRAPP